MIGTSWIGILCICVPILVACAGPTPTPPPEPIELRLTTVPYLSQLAQNLSQAFSQAYPYVTFEVSVRSSQDAIHAVAIRDVDIALVAESLDPAQEELESTPIGRQAVILAVHPSNPVDALTWDQVRSIFSGRVWDWASVDAHWQTQEILVVSQHDGAASRQAFESQAMQGEPVTPRARVATGDEAARQLIAEEPAAIGYLLAGAVHDNLKVLSVEGVEPDLSAILSDTWPVTRPLNLVTHIDANVYVLDFLDFSQG